jgi:hypothetical protein
MDLLVSGINALVVGAVGLALAWLGKGRFDAVEKRIDRLEERFQTRMDSFQTRMDSFQSSLDGLRSDLTQVALAVGARPRAENG